MTACSMPIGDGVFGRPSAGLRLEYNVQGASAGAGASMIDPWPSRHRVWASKGKTRRRRTREEGGGSREEGGERREERGKTGM